MNAPRDTFPTGAAVEQLLGSLRRSAPVAVYSDRHILRLRAVLSNSFPGKSLGFLLVWLLCDLLALFLPPGKKAVHTVLVANCRRTNHLREASILGNSDSSAWLGSPTKVKEIRQRFPKSMALDVCRDFALPPSQWLSLWVETRALRKRLRQIIDEAAPDEQPLFQNVSSTDLWMHANLMIRAEALHARCGAPEVDLGADSEIFGMSLARAAHRAGASVNCLQHGILNEHNLYGTCDRMQVWGHATADYVQKQSTLLERQPPLATVPHAPIHQIETMRLPGHPAKRILFLDQDTPFGRRMWTDLWLRELRQWLSQLSADGPRVNYTYRSHPSSADKKIPSGWTASDAASLNEDFRMSDIVLNMNSTAGVEAGAAARPTIFLCGPNMVWLESMRSLEPLFVRSYPELLQRVRELSGTPEVYTEYTQQCQRLCRSYLGLEQTFQTAGSAGEVASHHQ